jgi:hypothetical protein
MTLLKAEEITKSFRTGDLDTCSERSKPRSGAGRNGRIIGSVRFGKINPAQHLGLADATERRRFVVHGRNRVRLVRQTTVSHP